MSVGEWLNDVIRPEDEDYGERARYADEDDGRGNGRRDPYRESSANRTTHRAAGRASRNRDAAKVTKGPGIATIWTATLPASVKPRAPRRVPVTRSG